MARGGKVVDERSRETKENNYYASSTSEIWEPVGIVHRPRNIKPFDSSDESRPNSNASSDQGYTTNTSSNHVLREHGGGSSTVGCPICEDNDPDCARRCLGGLAGLGTKVPVQTANSAVSCFPCRDPGSKSECISLAAETFARELMARWLGNFGTVGDLCEGNRLFQHSLRFEGSEDSKFRVSGHVPALFRWGDLDESFEDYLRARTFVAGLRWDFYCEIVSSVQCFDDVNNYERNELR